MTRFGTIPALLVSGAVWGLLNAPLTLLGYNYPDLGAGATPMFIGFCTVYGVLLGWLRLYSGSIWPAVVSHGALNAITGISFLFGDAQNPPNLAVVGITGAIGWVLIALTSVVLLRVWPVHRRHTDITPAEQ